MNEQQLQKSEHIAATVMRVLAIVGLVAVLAFVAWLIVWGVRGTGSLSAAVSAVTSVFRSAPVESINFELGARTLTSGKSFTASWAYAGPERDDYMLSYSCTEGVRLSARVDGVSREMVCNTPISMGGTSVELVPTSEKTRFADVELKVAAGTTTDTTVVTIVNSSISLADGSVILDDEKEEEVNEDKDEAVTPPTAAESGKPVTPSKPVVTPAPAPAPVKPMVQPVVPATPADLVVNIEETGILVRSGSKNIFYEVSPIPTNKTAAVRFTVTNRGGKSSGTWAFVARLPVEGDNDYKYVSPIQNSLAPGMQVEFTLGFDELLEERTGTIRIEVIPSQKTDRESNNTDTAKVSIREV